MQLEFERGIQDCPHCLSRVYILDDGICPGCQGDAREPALTTRMALWIHETDKVPDVCHKCGCTTSRRVRVSYVKAAETQENKVERDSDFIQRTVLTVLLWVLGVGIFFALAAVVRQCLGMNSQRKVETVSIRIPECRDCKSGQVEPISGDIPDRSLKIAVDRQFADKHEQLNKRQASANPYDAPER